MKRSCLKELSPSSIDLWRQCPRRFAYSQGLIAGSPASIAASAQPGFEQLLGTTVHKVLESLLRAEPQLRTPEALKRAVDWYAVTFARKANMDPDRLRHDTEALVSDYLTRDGATASPIAVERRFSLSLTDHTVITTRVDRLDGCGNVEDDEAAGYEIIDYKTTRPENQIDSRDLAYETAPIVQLLAVSHATDVPVERVTWLYLRSGESVTWWPEEDDVEAATERLLETVRRIQADDDFEAAPGGHCAYCPFASECPATTRLAGSGRPGTRSNQASAVDEAA